MNWYVTQTKPCQENKAAFNLRQKDIAVYLPMTQVYVYKNLKKYKKTKPLFPGYIFARVEKNRVHQLCWTSGVKKVLWENTNPKPISDDLIHSLKSLAAKDGLITPRCFKPNDVVRIKSTPLKISSVGLTAGSPTRKGFVCCSLC